MLILETAILFNGSGVIIYVPIGLSYYGLKGFNLNRCWPRNNTGHKDELLLFLMLVLN
jgi:hypothetical protein